MRDWIMQTVCVRLTGEQLKKIRRIEDEESLDRSTIFRKVVDAGVRSVLLEEAVRKYSAGEVSTWKAAELAGVSLRKMMDELCRRGVPSRLSDKDVEEELS